MLLTLIPLITLSTMQGHLYSIASIAPANAAAVLAALDVIKEEPERITPALGQYPPCIKTYKIPGFDTGVQETPIIPIYVGMTTNLPID